MCDHRYPNTRKNQELKEKTGKMFIDLIFNQEYLGMYILTFLEGKRGKEWCNPEVAAANGHLHIVQHLNRLGRKCNIWGWCKAAANGHVHILEWLVLNGVWFNFGIHNVCLLKQEIPERKKQIVVEFLISVGATDTARIGADVCAERGQLGLLKVLHKAGYPCNFRGAFKAALGGHISVVEWLVCDTEIFNNFVWRRNIIEKARAARFSRPVEYLLTLQDKKHALLIHASLGGNVNVVEFLLSQSGYRCSVGLKMGTDQGLLKEVTMDAHSSSEDIDCTSSCADLAAKHGYLHILEFLYTKGIKCSYGMADESSPMLSTQPIRMGANVVQWLMAENVDLSAGPRRKLHIDSDCTCACFECGCLEELASRRRKYSA